MHYQTNTPRSHSSGLSLTLLKPWLTRFAQLTIPLNCKPSVILNTSVKYISSRPWTQHFVPAASHLPPPPCCSRSQIHQSGFFLDAVRVDSDHILHDRVHNLFRQVLQAHQDALNVTIVGYTAPPAPLKPPSIWVPYKSHNVRAVSLITPTRVELQEKFDQLEQFQVLHHPEDVRIKETHSYF